MPSKLSSKNSSILFDGLVSKPYSSYMIPKIPFIIGENNPTIIQKLIDPMNPFAHGLLQQAVEVSARTLSEDYSITRVISKEGHLLMIY